MRAPHSSLPSALSSPRQPAPAAAPHRDFLSYYFFSYFSLPRSFSSVPLSFVLPFFQLPLSVLPSTTPLGLNTNLTQPANPRTKRQIIRGRHPAHAPTSAAVWLHNESSLSTCPRSAASTATPGQVWLRTASEAIGVNWAFLGPGRRGLVDKELGRCTLQTNAARGPHSSHDTDSRLNVVKLALGRGKPASPASPHEVHLLFSASKSQLRVQHLLAGYICNSCNFCNLARSSTKERRPPSSGSF